MATHWLDLSKSIKVAHNIGHETIIIYEIQIRELNSNQPNIKG